MLFWLADSNVDFWFSQFSIQPDEIFNQRNLSWKCLLFFSLNSLVKALQNIVGILDVLHTRWRIFLVFPFNRAIFRLVGKCYKCWKLRCSIYCASEIACHGTLIYNKKNGKRSNKALVCTVCSEFYFIKFWIAFNYTEVMTAVIRDWIWCVDFTTKNSDHVPLKLIWSEVPKPSFFRLSIQFFNQCIAFALDNSPYDVLVWLHSNRTNTCAKTIIYLIYRLCGTK